MRGPDPYVSATCDYREPAQQFGESFECSERLGHGGSHYDSYLNQYRPR